ncbi:Protein of unknown function [Pyronema omphalodes CBS 100304]|uniref:Uncharacterized protein n=1 Tax=Pyronema omphalodes (strain CBS 100304) TaxID=1076935 RepID=U4L8H4_PYROM|nr:Protein of unknown function [Pyronema omphalodes CBS 100304]
MITSTLVERYMRSSITRLSIQDFTPVSTSSTTSSLDTKTFDVHAIQKLHLRSRMLQIFGTYSSKSQKGMFVESVH